MINEVVDTFEATVKFVQTSVAELSDQQMIEQPPGTPNHGMWTLGHLVYSCQGIAVEMGDPEWLPAHWESEFGYGSLPHSDTARYPTKEEMLRLLDEASARLRRTLLSMNADGWTRSLPDESLPTVGHLILQVVVAHTAYHAGQLGVWRRAIGLPPAEVFV